MKNRFFLVIKLIILSLMLSCHQNEQDIKQNDAATQKNITQKIASPMPPSKKDVFEPMGMFQQKKSEPLREELLEILKNEIKDFSSYETHPLDTYLGKWNLMDKFGNAMETIFSIEIFCDDFQFRYLRNYYNTVTKGRVIFTNEAVVILWPDNIRNSSTLYHLWKPQKTIDDEWTFFVSEEWPVGYFLRMDDEANFLSAWKIDNVNGVWISDQESADGALWINDERASMIEELKSAAACLEFDLDQKTVFIPGQGQLMVETVFKNDEDHICLTAFSPEAEAQEEPVLVKIIPLDFSKAYIIHDQWEKRGDKRFSPDEKWAWYRL